MASMTAAGKRIPGGSLAGNLLAGLTLAAIAIPAQMATARLGGFEPQIGLYAFVGATLGFAFVGANRILSSGADSTIAPIFASALATLSASGTPTLASTAVTLAILVAVILIVAGLLRLGWIADLLSTPIVTGFLAGIAVHILVSQLPDVLGLAAPSGSIFDHLAGLYEHAQDANPWSTAIGVGVLAVALAMEAIDPRLPGALIAVALATLGVVVFSLEARGVAILGVLPSGLPVLIAPTWSFESLRQLVPLALVLALIVMMQTATVSRSFGAAKAAVDINRDFVGVGAANLGAALLGTFPVNASPPSTAIVREAGGTSQLGVLIAGAIVAALALGGGSLLAHVPQAALAGVLLFVALRIVRVQVIAEVAHQAKAEFGLILLTAAAVIVLPIPAGVAVGIGLSLLHGVWITTQTRVHEFKNVPGTTIWWPATRNAPDNASGATSGESCPGVLVAGFPAPLLFANAETFRHELQAMISAREPLSLVVLEGGGIANIDYTAAQALKDVIEDCRVRHIDFAIARLESVRAQRSLAQFGVLDNLGADRLFHSVAQAVAAMAIPKTGQE